MALEAVRAIWGAVELVEPAVIGRALLGHEPDDAVQGVMRILGARHLVQAAAVGLTGGKLHSAGGVVDLLHAGSMVALAAMDARRRRTASVSACVALAFAVAEFAAAARRRRMRGTLH
jgi:hypothetical protein